MGDPGVPCSGAVVRLARFTADLIGISITFDVSVTVSCVHVDRLSPKFHCCITWFLEMITNLISAHFQSLLWYLISSVIRQCFSFQDNPKI